MSSLNFIGGEKGGVGKSVAARVLAQYFLDKGLPFIGFDTDRSHTSFTRFYADYAAPVVVDSYEGLDLVVGAFEETLPDGQQSSVIVDLAAQTAAPLSRWVKDSDLIAVLSEMGVTVNFWHLADAGKDSVDLLQRLIDTYGAGPNYLVVKNLGRGSDFSQLDAIGCPEECPGTRRPCGDAGPAPRSQHAQDRPSERQLLGGHQQPQRSGHAGPSGTSAGEDLAQEHLRDARHPAALSVSARRARCARSSSSTGTGCWRTPRTTSWRACRQGRSSRSCCNRPCP
jgi:hypothetical protein